MGYLIGIDNGGTFSKAAVFSETGIQLSVASIPTKLLTPKPGYTERDMNELWKVNVESIRKAISLAKINPNDIAGISFSGHGKGLYMVGNDGKPEYNGIISTDTRAWKEVAEWYSDGTNKKVYTKTIQEILACQPVSILKWFQKNNPQIIKNTKYIFSVKDYIRYMITGEACAEYTDSSGGNLVNLHTKSYDMQLLKYFGLEEIYNKLPPLRQSSDICGYVSHNASQQIGVPEGIPVAAGMFDIDACGIASGLRTENDLCMIAGTWSINEFIKNCPIDNGTIDLNSLFCIPGYYLIEESSPTSAGNLEWFISNLMSYEKSDKLTIGESIYNLTNRLIKEIEPQDNNLIFLPFLNGSNENPLAKGTFVGLTAYHQKRHMLRAVYEGIVFSHLTHVKRLLQNREKPESIRLSGGAANSRAWVQIFADVLQIPIDTIGGKELGAQGAAMAAGIAAGVYKNYDEAIERTVHITNTVYPRLEYKEIYERKYQAYRTVVDGLNEVWKCFEN